MAFDQKSAKKQQLPSAISSLFDDNPLAMWNEGQVKENSPPVISEGDEEATTAQTDIANSQKKGVRSMMYDPIDQDNTGNPGNQ